MTHTLQLRGGKKWLPVSISRFESHLSQLIAPCAGIAAPQCRALCKNVAYSLQHFEFLVRCQEDLSLTSVVWTQTIKTQVVVGCSILEALFYFLLVRSGKAATTDWQSHGKVISPEFDLEGKKRRLETEYFTRLQQPLPVEMTFDAMCKRVESRDLATLRSDEFYKHLPYLRKLRNRVHIHDIDGLRDTDWVKFNSSDLALVACAARFPSIVSLPSEERRFLPLPGKCGLTPRSS